MPGIAGTGGIDSAGNVKPPQKPLDRARSSPFSKGDNNKLRLILYAPRSKFENDTTAAYKQNKPIGIQEEDTDDEYEPASSDPGPPRKRTRFGGGGMGLMGSQAWKGGGGKVRNLGDGWYMSYASTTSILPLQIGAGNLETFYTQVLNAAANQISTVVNATQNLAFSFNGLTLRLASAAPISWTWVINFAADMLRYAGDIFVVLFSGEAYSYYWEIAAVTASLTHV